MDRELLQLAADLARQGEPFALATVVSREPPISTHAGDMALVTQDGTFHGWVGGSCTRPMVVTEALKALEDGRPRLVALAPDPSAHGRPGLEVFPMTCHSGGSVEIHIQPVLPAPCLLVYGLSPPARALVRLGKAAGFAVTAVDPDADATSLAEADTVAAEAPAELRRERRRSPLFAVVATQGEWDEEAVAAALALEPDYLGVVASPKRFEEMRRVLSGRMPEDALRPLRNPAGLDLGAVTPEEVALSILAEIVKERRASPPRPARRPLPMAEEARDPVCGMTVDPRTAAARAVHEGREYVFCCAGCSERFLASPERYASAGTGR